MLRGISERGLADWSAFSSTDLFPRLVESGKLVATEALDRADVAPELADAWAALLRHEQIPFVSYPYEWTFGMLQDAALLQLELLLSSLDEGLILKDATPYNVQWRGAKPVFIDVGSFERARPGEAWTGYRQFCMLFLYPLLLRSLRGLPFAPWLRGSIEGIAPADCRRLLATRDLFRRGVFVHVYLHAKLERRYGDRSRDVARELRSAGFSTELIRANARKLERLVRSLEPTGEASPWTDYRAAASYDAEDAERKAAFVRTAVEVTRPRLVWDFGCNDGRYARIAAESGAYVVAMDADEPVVDRLYRGLRADGSANVLPLVIDVADPSPGLGWRNRERRTLVERGAPDLTLCLALVHHLAIARNVPVAELVDWLRTLGGSLVIELATPEDAMVERLLAGKREGLHADYGREPFERALRAAFEVERTEELSSGTRVLYLARPRE